MAGLITRRKLMAGIAAGGSSVALSACTGPTYNTFFQNNVLSIGQWLNYRVQRLITGNVLAQEFPASQATSRELEKVAGMVAASKLSGRDKIGVRVGKVIGKYKMAKHFDLDIQDAALAFSVKNSASPPKPRPSARSRAWSCMCARSATGLRAASRPTELPARLTGD